MADVWGDLFMRTSSSLHIAHRHLSAAPMMLVAMKHSQMHTTDRIRARQAGERSVRRATMACVASALGLSAVCVVIASSQTVHTHSATTAGVGAPAVSTPASQTSIPVAARNITPTPAPPVVATGGS